MSWPELSIRRPVFVASLFLLILGLGWVARGRLGVSLYPDVSYPIVNVMVPYPGAGPEEIEAQVARPIEDALSSLSGLRTLRSTSRDGAAFVTAVFGLDTDMRFAEQKVAQAVARVRTELPRDIQEPTLQSVDPSATPVLTLALRADEPEERLYDLADRQIRPALEEVPQVGLVEIQGARKREIQVELDLRRLAAHEVTASEVAERVGAAGLNLPAGRVPDPRRSGEESLVRTIGQFGSLQGIRGTVIRFVGNDTPLPLSELGEVKDGLEDEKSRVYVDGKPALILEIYRQAAGNTVAVADEIRARVRELNARYGLRIRGFELTVARDASRPIREGTQDATEAIEIGVLLTVVVVLFFLGSLRSTVITGLALPNSLLGAFALMWAAGFTINITTLAALSLAVGLLIDDAIVVRENIFRRMQEGESPGIAAVTGTREVTLAVVATTLTVLSVFGPISFLRGIAGQFFRQFGLTICFAMLISLLDSLTVAPMLSAYFGGAARAPRSGSALRRGLRAGLDAFERYQRAQERLYERVLTASLRHPLWVLLAAGAIFALSIPVLAHLPKSFIPSGGTGELVVSLDLPPGASLEATDHLARQAEARLRSHPEVQRTVLIAGGARGSGEERQHAEIFVRLGQASGRGRSSGELKERFRQELLAFPQAKARVQDAMEFGGGAGQPFVMHLSGDDLGELGRVSAALVAELSRGPDLTDVDSSLRAGAPELRIDLDRAQCDRLGVSAAQAAQELRTLLAGTVPARFREQSNDYGIRVRLQPEQRNLAEAFSRLRVPNINQRLLPLPEVSHLTSATSPGSIERENRRRFVEISADLSPHGHGLQAAIGRVRSLIDSARVPLGPGMRYEFAGQTRDFEELLANVLRAAALSVGFMYLVLASLYDSFFVPLAIMLVLPLAVCGAFYALALGGTGLDIYSLVGCILLLGVAAKNSILLVDSLTTGIRQGRSLRDAILHAGRVRLRPIMMTSFALVAGMLPVAVPLEEAARSRAGMAIAVIGGIVSSTLLTLVVVPASYAYIVRFQSWVLRGVSRFRTTEEARTNED